MRVCNEERIEEELDKICKDIKGESSIDNVQTSGNSAAGYLGI